MISIKEKFIWLYTLSLIIVTPVNINVDLKMIFLLIAIGYIIINSNYFFYIISKYSISGIVKIFMTFLIYLMLSALLFKVSFLAYIRIIGVIVTLLLHLDLVDHISNLDLYFSNLLKMLFLLHVVGLVLYIITPELVIMDFSFGDVSKRFAGLVGHPIIMGLYSTVLIGLTLFISSTYLNKVLKVLFLFTGIISLYLTNSRGNIVFLIISILLLLVIRYRCFLSMLYYVCFITIIVLTISYTFAPFLFDLKYWVKLFSRSGDVEELITLSGRTYIWIFIFEQIKSNLFLGIGYTQGADILSNFYISDNGYIATNTHNAYIHILFELGILGLIIYILMFRRMFKQIKLYSMHGSFLVVLFTLYGINSSGFFVNLNGLSYLIIIPIVELAFSNYRTRNKENLNEKSIYPI